VCATWPDGGHLHDNNAVGSAWMPQIAQRESLLRYSEPAAALQRFLHLDLRNTEQAVAMDRFTLDIPDQPLLGAKRRCPMGVAGWRFAHTNRTRRLRAVVVAVLEELPLICAAVVALGSLILSVTALWMSLPR
jgi:hypothetical protein